MGEGRKRPFRKSLREYLDTIALSRRQATIEVYRCAVEQFIRYLEASPSDISSFSDLRRSHVEGWFRHLARKEGRTGGPLRPATKRSYIGNLRGFLTDLEAWGWEEAPPENLFHQGDMPPLDRHLPKALSLEADQALRRELERKGGLLANALLLLRSTGMRIGEILNLELDSLQKLSDDEWAIKVPLGKLHSERYIPVDPATVKIYEEIRRLRGVHPPLPHPETGMPTHFFLLCPDGQRPPRMRLWRALRRAAKRAQLSEKVWPHRLRHTFATEMLRAGMSLPVLMKILGHRSVVMTLRYVDVTQSDIRRTYLESMERVKTRYGFPEPPPPTANPEQTIGRRLIGPQLLRIATEVEGFRRDHAKGAQRKKLQRFVEKLRRLIKDTENLGA